MGKRPHASGRGVALSGFSEDDADRKNAATQPTRWGEPEEGKKHAHENQIGPRNTHGFGHVLPYLCASKRQRAARRTTSAISGDSWRVGDLRLAVREIEIGSSVGKKQLTQVRGVIVQKIPVLGAR